MRVRLLSLFLCLLAGPVLHAAQPAPVRLSYLYSDGNVPATLAAVQALYAQHPELRERVQLTVLTESTFADTSAAAMQASDVLVFDVMNEQMVSRFDTEHDTDLLRAVNSHGVVLGVGQGLQSEEQYAAMGVRWDRRAQAYWEHSGAQNQLSLLKLALTYAGIEGLPLPEPQPSLDFGYYYPGGESGRVFATWAEFDGWRAANGRQRPGAPRVAISFFKATYYTGDTALLNALIAELERHGANAIPVFGYPGEVTLERLLRDENGEPRADVVLGGNFNFADVETAGRLERLGIPVLNLISLYGRSEQDWRSSATGLSMFEGTFNLAVPELAGTIVPTVVGTKEKQRDALTGITAVVTQPIPSQVERMVGRALRYANLRQKANAEKRLAILFYNFPAGKANIGASYLNVAESLANILARLAAEGYDIGGRVPTADEVLADITTRARNVSSHAPGELEELVATGNVVRIPVARYRTWLDGYAPTLKEKILKDWGEPERSTLMTVEEGGSRSLLIPVVQYGKVLLTPQPVRGWGEDLEQLHHAANLAPPHQYVAAYRWLRDDYRADAVVHVGTHGTLEWLDGRDAGLNEEDASDALIADLPNLYIYNVDVVGEGLVARRRSHAQLIDHMVPPFRKGELTEELAKLGELMNDHTQNESKNPELAAIYARQVREQAGALGIAKELGLDPAQEWTDEQLHGIETYLVELKGQIIPYGLHAFGRTPTEELRNSTVEAVVSADRSLLPDERKILASDMDGRILKSGPRELDGLMRALGGQFVPAGTGGEPVRNPDAYPTGKNFYGIDPEKVPKPAAWEMGVKLADQMLDDHLAEHGRYPEKVSFVIWGDETMRHEGVLESQIFRLLGTKPVWDARGKVVDVEVVPRAQLGRPRVDIVIASAAEGMFGNVTRLMDEAVQRVKALDEADNLVRKHYLATRAALINQGYDADKADRLAGVRIFDEPPGTYNLNTSAIVAASGSWDTDAAFAGDYIRKMGHGYGNGFWGESMEDVFRLALSGVEKVVHSSSTTLYGALDNDDMYMYMGGLAAAVRSIDGATPDMVVTNTRDPGKPEMTGLDKFVGQEFRSRYVNPLWIRGMQKEGYAGAGEMRAFTEYMWGWDATVSSVVDDRMWQETFEVYVNDKHELGMQEFFEQHSPFAYQDMTARMLETIRKGYWQADEQTRTTLLREYIESINLHGVSCAEHTCGNARLLEYVMQQAQVSGLPVPDVQQAREALEKAIGQRIEVAAQTLREFVARNEALPAAPAAASSAQPVDASAAQAPGEGPEPPATSPAQTDASLRGFILEAEDRSKPMAPSASTPIAGESWHVLWFAVPLFALLFGWRWRYRSQAAV